MPSHPDKNKRRLLFWDLVLSFGTAVVLLVLNVVATAWWVDGLNTDDFGRFSLIRRTIGLFYPVFLWGTHIGMVRSLAIARARKERILPYFLAGLGVLALGIIGGAALEIGFGKTLGTWFFGFETGPGSRAMLWYLLATIGMNFVYSIYRGTERISHANLFFIVTTGLIPLAGAAWLVGLGPFGLTETTSWMILGFSGVFILGEGIRLVVVEGPCSASAVGTALRDLLGYGIWRIGAPLAMGAVFLIGPILLNQSSRFEAAGHFFIALSVFRVFEQALGPIAIVMLPKLSELQGQQNRQTLSRYAEFIFASTAALGVFTSLQGFLHSKTILEVWLAPKSLVAAPTLQVLMLGFFPVFFLSLAQTFVDSITRKGVVFWSGLAGLAIHVASLPWLIAYGAQGISAGIVICQGLSSLLLLRFMQRQMRIPTPWRTIGSSLAVNLAFFLAGGVVLYGLGLDDSPLVWRLAFAVFTGLLYLWVENRLRQPWLVAIKHLVFG